VVVAQRRQRQVGAFPRLVAVLGGIAVNSAQTLATNLLIGTMMVSSAAPSWWNQLPGLPMSTILTGLGLIVVARILQAGRQMQDDLARTV
jgi:hypothetical protein